MKKLVRNFLVIAVLCAMFTVVFSGKAKHVSAVGETASSNDQGESASENDIKMEFVEGEDGKVYWYEDGVKQGAPGDPKNIVDEKFGNIERGREIFDPASNGWYWLDANADGAKASNKEVWMPYIYQDEAKWTDEQKNIEANESNIYTEDPEGVTAEMSEQILRAIENKEGKWVRYDENGKMYKGWVTLENWQEKPEQNGNTYYYDYRTGLMAKGETVIGGQTYMFDEVTGVCQNPPVK